MNFSILDKIGRYSFVIALAVAITMSIGIEASLLAEGEALFVFVAIIANVGLFLFVGIGVYFWLYYFSKIGKKLNPMAFNYYTLVARLYPDIGHIIKEPTRC